MIPETHFLKGRLKSHSGMADDAVSRCVLQQMNDPCDRQFTVALLQLLNKRKDISN